MTSFGARLSNALIGRDQEMARLATVVEAVSGGDGQVVIVEGDAGIGKSRLVEEIVGRCEAGGFGVFAAAVDEVDQQRPFGVVGDALCLRNRSDPARVEIGRLLDGQLGAGAGRGLEWRIADLLAGLVAEACRDRPAIVVLDDLQWADESSLVAINGFSRLVPSHPVLVLCAMRRFPEGRTLRALMAALRYRGAHHILLGGLDPGETRELAEMLAGAPPGRHLDRVLEETGGNPLYIGELIRCLVSEGKARISDEGFFDMGSATLPTSLVLTIVEELRLLPAETLDVLRSAAVVGRTFGIDEVTLISPTSVADVVASVKIAELAGFVSSDGERFTFRHDLIRQAIYQDLSVSARRALHRDLASALAHSGAPLERVAAQLMLGAKTGDSEAIAWLCRAASEVTPSSPAVAATLLWRARELAGQRHEQLMAVLVDLVRPLMWTGQAQRVEEVCSQALQLGAPPQDEPLFWLGLVNSQLLQGRFEDARKTALEARPCHTLTESDRLHLRTASALAGVYAGVPGAIEHARTIAATAPISIPRALAQEAVAQWELFRGRADLALAAYEQVESMRDPPQLESRIWQASGIRVRIWEALALLDLDRLNEAGALLDEEIASKLAVPALPHAFLALCQYHSGHLSAAMHECRVAVAASEAGGTFIPASALGLAASITLRQGHVDDAEDLAAQGESVRGNAEAGGGTLVRWARTLILEARGETHRAADAAGEALEAYRRAGFASFISWHAADFVRIAVAADRVDQAAEVVKEAESVANSLPVASRRAGALRARGLLIDDPTILVQATEAARESGRPLDLAFALRDAAVSLARAGRPTSAQPLAREAIGLLGDLGAVTDDRHARQVLRRAGLNIGTRRKHTSPDRGWASLTESELRVVALVADGRTNPEIAAELFLSRRTVGWHLSNVLRKLGLSSRGGVAAEAVRRGLR